MPSLLLPSRVPAYRSVVNPAVEARRRTFSQIDRIMKREVAEIRRLAGVGGSGWEEVVRFVGSAQIVRTLGDIGATAKELIEFAGIPAPLKFPA